MTPPDFESNITSSIDSLLKLTRSLTRNKISTNCRFILSEIKESPDNFHVQRLKKIKENDKKTPVALSDIMPELRNLCPNIYDLDLKVYRVTRKSTIIEFSYYPKSSLDARYRAMIVENLPMIHCKVATPPWQKSKNQIFNINWEHQIFLARLRLFWLKMMHVSDSRI